MTTDGKSILNFIWIATILSLFLFIPKGKVRLALVAYLFFQTMSWPLGLFVADMGWIQYPIRFFEKATQASFTFEYFFCPVMCAYFIIYYPEGKRLSVRAAYCILICLALTLVELLILQYTQLVRYVHWNAYTTWVTLLITYLTTRKFCLWFFKPHITLVSKPKTIKSLFIRLSKRW